MQKLLFIVLLSWQYGSMAQTPTIEISTKNSSDRENTIVVLLKEVLSEYDLAKWTFTKKVIIEQRVIPHSHPVLTLNTGSTDKVDILDAFAHEQLHWYVDKDPESEKKVIDEFKKRYPNVPYQNRAGARDKYSTYMHIIVCFLEYRSMASLISEVDAKQLMWNLNHYTWVYNKIIEDTAFIGNILEEYGFDLVE